MLISFKSTYIVQAPYRPVQGHHNIQERSLQACARSPYIQESMLVVRFINLHNHEKEIIMTILLCSL